MSDETKPKRIQLRRTAGWRLPPNTVSVARPSLWGNPFKVGATVSVGPPLASNPILISDRAQAVALYREWITDACKHFETFTYQLRGKDLACWCPLDGGPCHADVLLEFANREPAS